MQLYALKENVSIFVSDAEKGKDYLCPGCKGVVRKREGKYRQKHFFHISRSPSCREAGKSLLHIQVQNHLMEVLPVGESVMEKPFPEIQRIADIAWVPQKILFEIQCSPISREEANARNGDYGSLGWTVIWLLSDRLFNKRLVKDSELYLRSELAYYFQWAPNKPPLIYDQAEIFTSSVRSFQSGKFPLSLSQIKNTSSLPKKRREDLPSFLLGRWDKKVFFSGDLLDQHLEGKAEFLKRLKVKKREKKDKNWIERTLLFLWELLLRKS